MTRTPSITQPPFALPAATHDETAPRGRRIRKEFSHQKIDHLATFVHELFTAPLVSPDDLQQEMAAFHER